MRNFLSLILLLLMPFLQPKPTQKIKQGICGTILLKQGNQMPGPGRTPSVAQPVKREVAIYKITNVNEVKSTGAFFTGIKTACVAKVSSNAKGYFEIALPAGQYSVFVVEQAGLYANSFNSKGNINAFEVLPDSVICKDIYISHQAAF
jgi:hypothetical protein